jgi:hypothetical protein
MCQVLLYELAYGVKELWDLIFFFEGTVTADAYLKLLRDVVLLESENSPQYEDVTLIW